VAIHSSTGATTPVTFETCATLTSRVRFESFDPSSCQRGTASSSMSTSTALASRRHGM
jgi:hypothetical protein